MPAGLVILLLSCALMAVFWAAVFIAVMRVLDHELLLLGRPLPVDIEIEGLALPLIIAIAAMAVVLVILLLRRRTAVRVVIALLWLGCAAPSAISFAHHALTASYRIAQPDPEFWITAGQTVVALVATIYLQRSRRVARFYQPHAGLSRVFD
jgi:hypothetical protein